MIYRVIAVASSGAGAKISLAKAIHTDATKS